MCLSIIIVIFVFTMIFYFSNKNYLKTIYPQTQNALYDMEEKEVIDTLGIKKEWIKSQHALSSIVLISAERIFMFSCNEDHIEDVRNACLSYVDTLKQQFNNSSELNIVKSYKEYYKDTYYILVISEDATSILKEIKERI